MYLSIKPSIYSYIRHFRHRYFHQPGICQNIYICAFISHYQLSYDCHSDTLFLSGMGCSAGLISIELVKNLLAAKVMVPVYASLSGVIQIIVPIFLYTADSNLVSLSAFSSLSS